MDLQDMMNAMANALRAELDNSMDFIRTNNQISGIWVKQFPTNATEKSFLTAYCNKEAARGAISESVASALVDKVYDRRYTKTPNATKGGFDVVFLS